MKLIVHSAPVCKWSMDWTNEFTLEFLKFYKSEPVLWDPKHAHYKDRKFAYASWDRLSGLTELSVTELKRKKDSLMATFRSHMRKRKASIESGDEILYKPTWFAYDLMEDFLSPLYGVKRERKSSEEINEGADDTVFETPPPKRYARQYEQQLKRSESRTQTSKDSRPTPRRCPPELPGDPPDKLSNLNVTKEPKRVLEEGLDECDLYGQILAKKMRKLPELERAVLMHDIDGMLINALRSYL